MGISWSVIDGSSCVVSMSLALAIVVSMRGVAGATRVEQIVVVVEPCVQIVFRRSLGSGGRLACTLIPAKSRKLPV